MTTLMQRGAEWLGSKLSSVTVAGRTVTIRQGRTTLADVTGWCSMHQEMVDGEVLPLGIKSYDWSFKKEDLGTLKFRNGGTITETLNGEQVVYEVMPLGENEPTQERLDTSGILIVVHTKIICVDDA